MRRAGVTVAELLHETGRRLAASGSDTPRLDAEVLLGHVVGADRATLLASPALIVSEPSAAAYEELVSRRERGEPVSYLRGLKEFYGLALTVDPRALIPRPETETLVELALEHVGRMLTAVPRPPGSPVLSVLDVGTGSGAIAVAIATEARRRRYAAELRVIATDRSGEALALALENAVVHGVADAIEFALADLAEGRRDINLLVANLPYVPTAVVPTLPAAARYEPIAALDGGADGLRVISRLVAELPTALGAAGVALLEIGSDQEDDMRAMVGETLPDWSLDIHPDLAGRPRVAELRRSGQ